MSHLNRYPNQFFEPTPVRQATTPAGTVTETEPEPSPNDAAPPATDDAMVTAAKPASSTPVVSWAAPSGIDTLTLLLGLGEGMLVHGLH